MPERDAAAHGAAGRDAAGQGAAGRDAAGQGAAGHDAERARMEGEFLLAMRRTGSILQLLGQLAAERIGVNATDLNCLNLVALAGPLTAGELARQTGLTTASITGVLDRLEEGGFVRRERDLQDRRRVNVTLNPGPALAEIGPTFGPLVRAWRGAAASYSDDELRLLVEFQGHFLDIVREQLDRLRGEARLRGGRVPDT
ncbi:MAG TPA: MarR family transcriptional regulator [Streptosporangiaceae bacterium]|nr:MarR family transcriptional regulator [Streptosporangiaceae bacterium]